MKSFLIKISLFVTLLIALSYGIYHILNMYQQNYYGTRVKTRWIMELKDKHVDYLLLGSSRMANMVAGHKFDSILHSSSLNIATAASSYGESYLLFHQYLKNGNTAKTLILSFDLFKNRHEVWRAEGFTPLMFKHFDFFPYYEQTDIRNVYKDYTDSWHLYLWDYLPFSRYVEFNQYFKIDSAYSFLVENKQISINYDTTNGEQLLKRNTFQGRKYAVPGGIQMGPRTSKYLLEILKLAQKNNIKIILVTPPYYRMQPFDRKYHTQFVHFLEKQFSVRYIDFTAANVWSESRYFYDAIHTNASGSKLYTQMLADSLHHN